MKTLITVIAIFFSLNTYAGNPASEAEKERLIRRDYVFKRVLQGVRKMSCQDINEMIGKAKTKKEIANAAMRVSISEMDKVHVEDIKNGYLYQAKYDYEISEERALFILRRNVLTISLALELRYWKCFLKENYFNQE